MQIFDYGGEKLCLALVVDLTERRAMEEGLEEKEATLSAIMEAARDAIVMLNGQGNVTFWNPAAEQLFGYSREEILGKDLRSRRTGLSFSVIMADLDHFKDINDRFGHATGDRVLKSFVDMIQQRIRKTDCLARWGGEEFIILLTNIPVEKAAGLAEELRERLSQMDIPGVGRVNASFGVAGYCPGDTVNTLIMRADNMLYEAKSSERNCVRFTGACI